MREKRGRVGHDAVGDASVILKPSEDVIEKGANHAGRAKVSEKELQLADTLLDVQVAKIEPTVVGGEKAKFLARILTDSEFGENDGGHGFLDIFQLALVEVANWEAVSDTAQENAEVVDPSVVVFTSTRCEQAGVHSSQF